MAVREKKEGKGRERKGGHVEGETQKELKGDPRKVGTQARCRKRASPSAGSDRSSIILPLTPEEGLQKVPNTKAGIGHVSWGWGDMH